MAEIWNHFRRAAGEIDSGSLSLCEPIDDPIYSLMRHDLLALRPGVHMAMHAGEIAKLAHVDLKNFRARPAQRHRVFSQPLRETIHANISKRRHRSIYRLLLSSRCNPGLSFPSDA